MKVVLLPHHHLLFYTLLNLVYSDRPQNPWFDSSIPRYSPKVSPLTDHNKFKNITGPISLSDLRLSVCQPPQTYLSTTRPLSDFFTSQPYRPSFCLQLLLKGSLSNLVTHPPNEVSVVPVPYLRVYDQS